MAATANPSCRKLDLLWAAVHPFGMFFVRVFAVMVPCVVLGLAACNTPPSNPATGASPQNQPQSHPTEGAASVRITTGNTAQNTPPNMQQPPAPSTQSAILEQGVDQGAVVPSMGESRSVEDSQGDLVGVNTSKSAAPKGFASSQMETASFKVWYPDTSLPAFTTSCAAGASVQRTADSALTAEVVLRVLLQGPSESEQTKGLLNPFVSKPPTNKPLSAFFLRAVVNGKYAVLHFSKPALTWLGGPACVQESVKTAIENTLKDTLGITRIDYAIDGTIVVDWDA